MTKESPTVYVLQAIATTKRRKTYSEMGEYESLEEVKEAIKNGTMLKNKEFTVIQKLAIADATGDENGWITVMNNGCWYDVEIKERTGESGIAEYYLDYILVYAKGDWVRKVVGSHNLV